MYPYANGNFGHDWVVGIYIQRGVILVVVLLLDIQALPEPQGVEASNREGLHAFFLSLHYLI